jgi:hypothetical protein
LGTGASFRVVKVQDPSGRTWRVTRRWLPWRRRTQGWDTSWGWDASPDLADGVVLAILLFLLAPFLLLAIFVATELLLLLLLLPLAVLARLALGRQWTVEARRGFTLVWDTPAGDWQESDIRIHEVADAIRRGELPGAAQHAPPAAAV